jgi:hypothetical protein
MTYKRILIEEKEKQEILSKYGVISEQLDTNTGIYNLQSTQVFKVSGQKLGESPDNVYLFRDYSKVSPNNDDKSVSFNVYYKENNKYIKSGDKGKLNCGDYIFYIGKQGYQQDSSTSQPFKTKINQIFCNGNKLKTIEEIKGIKKEVEKEIKKVVNKSIKLPDLTYKNFCSLPNDKVWVYAKLDDGTWYASRNKVDWFKLDLPKYQKAIDLLTKDSKCLGIEEIPVLKVKELEQIKPTETNTVQTNIAPDQDNEERPLTP